MYQNGNLALQAWTWEPTPCKKVRCPTCAAHFAAVDAAVATVRREDKSRLEDWSAHRNQDKHKMTDDQRTGFSLALGVLAALDRTDPQPKEKP